MRYKPDPLTLLSCVLMILAFPPWNIYPFIWICFVPWFAAIHRAKKWDVVLAQGFWMGYGVCVGGFFWVAYVLKEFGNLPWIVSILGLLLYSLLGQSQFLIVAPMIKLLSEYRKTPFRSLWVAVVLSLIYSGVDWAVPKLFSDTLGYGLFSTLYIKQLADIGGVFLLSSLVFLVNDSIWILLKTWKQKHRLSYSLQFVFALGLCTAGCLYGKLRLDQVQSYLSQAKSGLQIAAIQGNIGDFEKVAAERGITQAAYKIIDTFMEMSDEALRMNPAPDVLIWPETSFPSTFRHPRTQTEFSLDQRVDSFVTSRKLYLLFGGYDHERDKDFNAFFLLNPAGQMQTYRKHILLPFGEFIPGASQFQFLREAFPQVGNFGLGQGITLFEIPKIIEGKQDRILIAPVICYEALFSGYLVDFARKGAQIIMNITNDSWFGTWGEPQLHLALSTFRTIETRLPMVRTTNTGISALILPTGEIVKSTEIGAKTIMHAYVPVTSEIPTLIKQWGNWFGPFSLIVGLGNLFGIVGNSRKRRQA
jgi:apolipoprotein N-acyltransferase